ncbi:MAG: fused MFS/spermidine synthase [Verrucomicrobia bacterium]|nr:fused MFS/spermidine synthase [Verrucomicrobiota bacterium]
MLISDQHGDLNQSVLFAGGQSSSSRQARSRQPIFWLLLCFVCSGMSGLVYEIAWVRSLELIFGATTFAVATVLAAFMGGLALGSYFMGRWAQRFERFHPLAVYAGIECCIAAFAIGVPVILKLLIPLYQFVWQHFHASFVAFSVMRFFLCASILIVPTFLMGATLPIVSSFVSGSQRGNNRRIGLLYTFNTVGAVFGCVAAGLILFPAIGLARTQWVAVTLNLLAAAGAYALARSHPTRTLHDEPADSTSEPVTENSADVLEPSISAPGKHIPLLVGLYAVSGFTAMLYEVAWSRVLVLVLGSSTYAYTIMLATFLLGLSLGAYWGTRLKTSPPLLLAALCQVGIAITTYFGIFLVEELPFFYLRAFENFHFSGHGLLAIQFALAIALMILPTLGLGAMFPVTIRGINPSRSQTARLVGWAYALNTCGAIAGSVLAGFWLVPRWGSQQTMVAGITLNALGGLLGILSARTTGSLARLRGVLALVPVALVASIVGGNYHWPPHILSSGIFRYVETYVGLGREQFRNKMREMRGDILLFKEGLTCTVTVCRTGSGLSLLVNGKPDASVPLASPKPSAVEDKSPLKFGDLPTQILLGEIPMLLAPRQERVMVIGLGSGVTVGSVLRHPAKEIECVELENVVVQGSRFFEQHNGGPLADKRVQLVVNDARNHLLVTDKKYDVVISEPSNPWVAGAASLFTREFFSLAQTRLQPDGIFCQWIQLYELRAEEFQAMLRGFTAAFPHVQIFRIDMDAILVGSAQENPISLARVRERLTPAVRSDLQRIECRSAEDVLAYHWIGGAELKKVLPPGPFNSDDNMLIEFAAPLRTLSRAGQDQRAFVEQLAGLFQNHSSGLLAQLRGVDGETKDQAEFWARQADAALRKRRNSEAARYANRSLELARNPLAAQIKGEVLWIAGRQADAKDWWTACAGEFSSDHDWLRATVLFFQRAGDFDTAHNFAAQLAAAAPDDRSARFLLGKVLYQQNQFAAALDELEPLADEPRSQTELTELPYYLGATYWRLGQFEAAVPPLEKFVEQIPNHLDARYRLADSLMRVGRETEAMTEWQRVGQLRSGAAQIFLDEGKSLWQTGQRAAARAKYEEALRFDPWNEEVTFALARARKKLGDVSGATELVQSYLARNPDRPWALAYLAQILGEQKKFADASALAARYRSLTGLQWRAVTE